jgi:acyl transferase domain-containing protein
LRKDEPMRITSAEISQPLCTALQLALIDLVRECGISFNAVVGHSSGEIAAAYAAGVLTAKDAILIAYYQGYHAHRTLALEGRVGKMMSVGMTPREAEHLCRQLHYSGRICVAAKNSGSSVTLSGDAEAINEAQKALDANGTFSRILKVDKAYHSHHMDCIRDPYLRSLHDAKIRPLKDCFGCTCNWYSSVYGPEDSINMDTPISFVHSYWAENLTNPVLFQDAISSAIQAEQFDLALEVGPHPALRGPATESIQQASSRSLPYLGVLQRGKDAVEAFSSALGFVWKNIESPVTIVDFSGFMKACNGPEWTHPRVQKDLPPY